MSGSDGFHRESPRSAEGGKGPRPIISVNEALRLTRFAQTAQEGWDTRGGANMRCRRTYNRKANSVIETLFSCELRGAVSRLQNSRTGINPGRLAPQPGQYSGTDERIGSDVSVELAKSASGFVRIQP